MCRRTSRMSILALYCRRGKLMYFRFSVVCNGGLSRVSVMCQNLQWSIDNCLFITDCSVCLPEQFLTKINWRRLTKHVANLHWALFTFGYVRSSWWFLRHSFFPDEVLFLVMSHTALASPNTANFRRFQYIFKNFRVLCNVRIVCKNFTVKLLHDSEKETFDFRQK